MSVQAEQQSSDDEQRRIERFYDSASSYTQRRLDNAAIRTSVDGEYISVHLTDSITSVAGYDVVAVVHGSDETTVLYTENDR